MLRTGYGDARTDLGTGYGAATGAINQGASGALGYLDTGTGDALGQLGQARGALTQNGGAFAPLSDLAGRYGAGSRLYDDSVGINGAAGNTRAQDAFTASPSYNWRLGQGVDAITRAANASGGLGGNSLKDTITYGQNLAGTEYGNWQDRLKGYQPLELSATGGAATGNAGVNAGVASTYGAGAGLLDSAGRAKAGVATGEGTNIADLARAYYGGLGGLDTGGANALAGNTIGANANNQNLFLNGLGQWNGTLQQDAKASTDASTNSLNLGVNLAKLAVGGAGGASGGGWFGGYGGAANPTGYSTNPWSSQGIFGGPK